MHHALTLIPLALCIKLRKAINVSSAGAFPYGHPQQTARSSYFLKRLRFRKQRGSGILSHIKAPQENASNFSTLANKYATHTDNECAYISSTSLLIVALISCNESYKHSFAYSIACSTKPLIFDNSSFAGMATGICLT